MGALGCCLASVWLALGKRLARACPGFWGRLPSSRKSAVQCLATFLFNVCVAGDTTTTSESSAQRKTKGVGVHSTARSRGQDEGVDHSTARSQGQDEGVDQLLMRRLVGFTNVRTISDLSDSDRSGIRPNVCTKHSSQDNGPSAIWEAAGDTALVKF